MKVGLTVVSLLTVLWLVASLAFAYRLTRRMRPPFPEPLPAVEWGQFEPHRFRTTDGEEIGAWLVLGRPDAPTVLLIPGIGASRSACLSRARMLSASGCTVLIISLRAQGDSTGDSNDMGFSSRHDVVAVVDFMKKRCPESPIIIHGLSMGAAAAVIGSGELADRVEGYILESPYRDLRTAVRNRTQNALPPLLDRIAYLGLLIVSPLVLPNLDKTAPVEAIKAIPADVPVLILAGEEDPVARPVKARAIFDRVQSHGRLVFLPHAGHLNFPETCPDLYQQVLFEFIDEVRKSRVFNDHQ